MDEKKIVKHFGYKTYHTNYYINAAICRILGVFSFLNHLFSSCVRMYGHIFALIEKIL